MEKADPNIGRVIAKRYRVSRYLFKDNFGSNYVGRDKNTRKQVFILFIQSSLIKESATLFNERAAAAQSLSHPNIVEVLYFESQEGEGVLISSWARARQMSKALNDRVLLSCATAWCQQIASALQYAHNQGIVHGRISPLVIRLLPQRSPPDIAQVSGWGLCHLRSFKDISSRSSVTSVNEAAWISPELAAGESCSPASDIYSLGTVLFHAVTGRPPFTGPTLKILAAHAYEPAPAPSSITSGIPMWIDNLVLQMLEKDPRNRPTIHEVLQALTVGRSQLSDSTAHPDHITANVAPVRMPQSDIRGTAASLPVVKFRDKPSVLPNTPTPAVPIVGILILVGLFALSLYLLSGVLR